MSLMSKLKKSIKMRFWRYRYKRHFLFPKSEMPFDAVFVIGANKTGTTSTHHFLRDLGLRHLTINEDVKRRYFKNDFAYLDYLTTRFHSFDDVPWNRLDVVEHFMKKDRNFLFILTIRDPNEWYGSFVRFYKKLGRTMEGDRNYMIEKKAHHDATCISLAKQNNKPLLIVDVTKDSEAGRKIANFLNVPVKIAKFPHVNRTK